MLLGHLGSAIPEFQLISEQASCLFLGEILGDTFWSSKQGGVCEIRSFILIFSRSLGGLDDWFGLSVTTFVGCLMFLGASTATT